MIQKVLGKNKMDVILVIKLEKRPLMTADLRERVQQENTAKNKTQNDCLVFQVFWAVATITFLEAEIIQERKQLPYFRE